MTSALVADEQKRASAPGRMRAVVHDNYGPPEVLRLVEIERPVPREDEVLVQVRATTVNRTDCGIRSASPFIVRYFTGLLRPKRKILGSEFAGTVEAVGRSVRELAVGDEVFGVNDASRGAHAEYLCIREDTPLAHKPATMSFEEAAAVCDGAILALASLQLANPLEGRSIVVYGASGSIGTAAVQLARHFGAHVTAVCDTKHVETVRALRADEVIDYTKDDFTRNGQTYDVIFDAVGKHSFRRCRRSLKPDGTYFTTDLGFLAQNPLLVLATRWSNGKRVRLPLPHYTKENVLFLRALIESGEYRAVIDRAYPLEQVVEATRYVETEQKTGNIVLTISASTNNRRNAVTGVTAQATPSSRTDAGAGGFGA